MAGEGSMQGGGLGPEFLEDDAEAAVRLGRT